jgi:hypothetical protein
MAFVSWPVASLSRSLRRLGSVALCCGFFGAPHIAKFSLLWVDSPCLTGGVVRAHIVNLCDCEGLAQDCP